MDIKKTFNHVSKDQLITCITNSGIHWNFVTWTKSFLPNRKIQLVINRNDNIKREIKSGILQELPVLPIHFLIYISRVFNAVTKNNSTVTSLSFIDNLGFIASRILVK